MQKIAIYPNQILFTPCTPVKVFSDIESCTTALLETFRILGDGCLGIAANQVGFSLRIIILRVNEKPVIMINPQVVSHSTSNITEREYCYSLPGISRLITAWEDIVIKYEDEAQKCHEIKLSDLESRAFQHEIQHLNGKTILDAETSFASASSSKLKRITRKYKGWRYV